MLWNNIKERCTPNGHTQTREPTYAGSQNKFIDFQDFTEWHRQQIGYGLGYQLDSDILKSGNKIYSKETCLLIPSDLNKFLQTSKGKRGKWPQGISLCGQRHLDCSINNEHVGRFLIADIELAKALYKTIKDKMALTWYNRLCSDEFNVDLKVIRYMKTWEHICDWKPSE